MGPQEGQKAGICSLTVFTHNDFSALFWAPSPSPSCLLSLSFSGSYIQQGHGPQMAPLIPTLHGLSAHGPSTSQKHPAGSWFGLPKEGLSLARENIGPRPHKPLIVLWPARSQANTKFGGKCGETDTLTHCWVEVEIDTPTV